MAEIGANYVLETPGGNVSFNTRFTNTWEWIMQDVDGLDGIPTRTPMENTAQDDGGFSFPSLDEIRHITMKGLVDPGPEGVTRRNIMENALTAACLSLKAADGTLRWTPTGLTEHTLTVRCDVQPSYPGKDVVKEYIFGLFAVDPTITVA